jgi:hypothetical protein
MGPQVYFGQAFAMATSSNLRLDFSLRGARGVIEAFVTPNHDPVAVGYSLLSGGLPVDFANGFPVCRATVAYQAEGYAAVFGWTQLVRSTEVANAQFEVHPIAIYSEVSTPFAWYGLKPTLFDAPSRETRTDMLWRAHSFLCVSPDAVLTRRVQAIAGFSWGFDISKGVITVVDPQPLDAPNWDEHLALLTFSYPNWAFDRGCRQ